MPTVRRPRRGSLQFYPRKRAKRIYPGVKFPSLSDVKPAGFAGYKVGMAHVQMVEKGKIKVKPITVLACPPLYVCGIRFYGQDDKGNLITLGETWSKELPKHIDRKLGKREKTPSFDFENRKDEVVGIRLIVATQPPEAGMHKLKPEVFELPIGGSVEQQYEYAKNVLGKEINVDEVFKPGEYCDVTAITKGKGFGGVVARFGVKEKRPKEKKTRRHTGSVGPTTPRRVMWQVPMPGQLGFHQRTEYNKRIISIIPGKDLNPKGGWRNYGIIKERSKAVLIEGSVPGSKKRLIVLSIPRRKKRFVPVEVREVILP